MYYVNIWIPLMRNILVLNRVYFKEQGNFTGSKIINFLVLGPGKSDVIVIYPTPHLQDIISPHMDDVIIFYAYNIITT